MRKYLAGLVLLLALFSETTFAGLNVALTFDDLPGKGLEKLAHYLGRQHLPAAGFVIGHDAEARADGKAQLETWAKNNLSLYNHTWSHREYSKADTAWFMDDAERVEDLLRPLRNHYGPRQKILRLPTLDYGKSEAKAEALEEYLKRTGTRLGHVSIDTSDWAFASAYEKAHSMSLRRLYLRHLAECISFSEKLSREYFGRVIPLIILLHANELNADSIPEITRLFKEKGYEFIQLEDALNDEAYRPFLQRPVSGDGDNFFFQLSANRGTPLASLEDPTSYAYYKIKWLPLVEKLIED